MRGVPRIGTVVARPPTQGLAARGRDSELTRDRILAAALAIADPEGLPALSLRCVAARLEPARFHAGRHWKLPDAPFGTVLLMTRAIRVHRRRAETMSFHRPTWTCTWAVGGK